MIKKYFIKFLNKNIKNKFKTVHNKTKSFIFNRKNFPLKTEIEIKEKNSGYFN